MLPRKGDRVRVIEVAGDSTLSVGDEVTLARDSHAHHDDWIHFDYVTVHYAKWSGAIKVELVDSPAIQSAREGLAKLEEMTGAHVIRDEPYQRGYQAGLRRAQELAKVHVFWTGEGIEFGDFDDAIEQEITK